jgi:hypothetical protein
MNFGMLLSKWNSGQSDRVYPSVCLLSATQCLRLLVVCGTVPP